MAYQQSPAVTLEVFVEVEMLRFFGWHVVNISTQGVSHDHHEAVM